MDTKIMKTQKTRCVRLKSALGFMYLKSCGEVEVLRSSKLVKVKNISLVTGDRVRLQERSEATTNTLEKECFSLGLLLDDLDVVSSLDLSSRSKTKSFLRGLSLNSHLSAPWEFYNRENAAEVCSLFSSLDVWCKIENIENRKWRVVVSTHCRTQLLRLFCDLDSLRYVQFSDVGVIYAEKVGGCYYPVPQGASVLTSAVNIGSYFLQVSELDFVESSENITENKSYKILF